MRSLIELAVPVLRAQHSLITRRHAIELGADPSVLDHAVRRGIWEVVDRGVYGPAGVAMTWHRRLMLATLLAPDGSLISHRASAALHGLGGLHEPTAEITIPRGRTLRRPWLITHESCDLGLAGSVLVDGVPTTDLHRLAMDLGGVVSFPRFKQTIREIRHGRGVDSGDLLRTYLRHKRQGRNGGAALRDWLDRYFDIKGHSESGAELVVLDAIIDAALPVPVRQHRVELRGHRYRLDLAYPALRVAIEVDGAQHDDGDIAANDEVRTARLEHAGWTILRVRARHLATDLPGLLRQLRSLVR